MSGRRVGITCIFSVLLCLPIASQPRSQGKRSSQADRKIQVFNDSSDRPWQQRPGLFISAQADTYLLAEFNFETGGYADDQGWIGVDITAQLDTFFHVDDFAGMNGGDFGRLTPLEGEKSLWCGSRVSTAEPMCSYASLPGYGDSWQQVFESVSFPVLGDATVAYKIRWDCETNWDFIYVEYLHASGYWVNVPVNGVGYYDGIGESIESYVISSSGIGDSLRLRFFFYSDGAWSDEDGLWDSDGAVIIDSLVILDATGIVNYQDFESESVGDRKTVDGKWKASIIPGYGDFSDLFPGTAVVQEDECTGDPSFLWGFFRGSTRNYACATPTPHPEQLVVPYRNARGQYLWNEIWSPWIEWNPGGIVPSGASNAVFDCRVYMNLPLDYLVFYVWHVRSKTGTDGCPGFWQDRGFVYYGEGPVWAHSKKKIADLIEPGATHVQLALGCWDLCEYWCTLWAALCHSHSPLFDRVKLYRINTTGPTWSVRDIDLFQDNFPLDGTTTGTVRMDAAVDRMPYTSPSIYPGDSIVATVTEPNIGLGVDPTHGEGCRLCLCPLDRQPGGRSDG